MSNAMHNIVHNMSKTAHPLYISSSRFTSAVSSIIFSCSQSQIALSGRGSGPFPMSRWIPRPETIMDKIVSAALSLALQRGDAVMGRRGIFQIHPDTPKSCGETRA